MAARWRPGEGRYDPRTAGVSGIGAAQQPGALVENTRRLEAQLRTASDHSSKLLKDADGIEAVVEVPGRGTLTLSVHNGGGYPLRASPEADAQRDESEERDWWRWGC